MVCPFIDQNLRGCGDILRLGNVEEAMELCADNFVGCQLFHRNYGKAQSTLLDVLRKTSALVRRG